MFRVALNKLEPSSNNEEEEGEVCFASKSNESTLLFFGSIAAAAAAFDGDDSFVVDTEHTKLVCGVEEVFKDEDDEIIFAKSSLGIRLLNTELPALMLTKLGRRKRPGGMVATEDVPLRSCRRTKRR